MRIRSDLKDGTITDNPLTVGATSVNSAQFATLPTVAGSDELYLTLDPDGSNPEIVKVTAHAPAATVCTVSRGQLGTTAAQHDLTTRWVHGAVTTDFVVPCTSSTRPTLGLWAGMTIFETDTLRVYVHDGTDWRLKFSVGAWTAYTPSDTNVTVGNGTRAAAYRMLDPKTCEFRWSLVRGSTSSFGGNILVGLPFTAVTLGTDLYQVVSAFSIDAGLMNYPGIGRIASGATTAAVLHNAGTNGGNTDATRPFTFGTGDGVAVQGIYEIA